MEGEIRLDSQDVRSKVEPTENEKLQKKVLELKHRICLLEFGMGAIALLLGEANISPKSTENQENLEADVGAFANDKRTIEGIGKVLRDVESCYKNAAEAVPARMVADSVIRAAPPVLKLAKVTTPIQLTEAGLQGCNAITKPTFFIDENVSGGNSLTSVCQIQVVENTSLPSTSKRAVEVTSFNRNTKSHYLDLDVDALSTLATVAIEKAQEAKCDVGIDIESQEVEGGMKTRSVNNLLDCNVPFKKRKGMEKPGGRKSKRVRV